MSTTKIESKSRIILALDVPEVPRALGLIEKVRHQIGMVKVGLQLINAQVAGTVAAYATKVGLGVFWDAKLDDIPHTVGEAARAALQFKPKMINVHASAGLSAICEVVNAVKGTPTQVLAVTVLTSHDGESTKDTFGLTRDEAVLHFARRAAEGGAQGIVCSARELTKINSTPILQKLVKVVPGTRSPGVGHHDQKNVTTPTEAILAGADWLVIGREITDDKVPANTAEQINHAVAEALAQREKES